VLSGVTLQISPQLVPGVESAIVDIQTTVSEPSQNPEPPMPLTRTITDDKGNTTGFGTIDRMNTISQEFKTTARVPLKKWTIVGGMTLEPASAAQDGRGPLVSSCFGSEYAASRVSFLAVRFKPKKEPTS
jgi:hypothetical protein